MQFCQWEVGAKRRAQVLVTQSLGRVTHCNRTPSFSDRGNRFSWTGHSPELTVLCEQTRPLKSGVLRRQDSEHHPSPDTLIELFSL